MSATGARRALVDVGRGKRQVEEREQGAKMPVESYAGLSDADVREHLPLVRQVVQRMLARKPPEISTEDLISWGTMGLLDAIQKYDQAREASFSTYAQYRIRGSILDYLRRCDWVPRSVRQRANDIEAATADLENRLGRRPRSDEVADALGLSLQEYSETLADCVSASLVSAAELGHGRGEEALSLDHVFADERATGPTSIVLRKQRLSLLARAIERLPEKERIAVSLYYFEGLTMREVADALDLTEGRISQLHGQAMSRLRVALTESHGNGDLFDLNVRRPLKGGVATAAEASRWAKRNEPGGPRGRGWPGGSAGTPTRRTRLAPPRDGAGRAVRRPRASSGSNAWRRRSGGAWWNACATRSCAASTTPTPRRSPRRSSQRCPSSSCSEPARLPPGRAGHEHPEVPLQDARSVRYLRRVAGLERAG